ncbi:MAG TPA: hypothetical protein VGM33_14070 [Baekduia sp.]|jgi:hypothetical protein
MSTAQRNDACLIAVDPELGDILRRQTLIVLEAHHHYFEDLLDFNPQAQYALSVIYRDAFAVLDTLGWSPDPDAPTIDVPLTAGHIIQLRRRLQDHRHTNLDRLATRDRQTDPDEIAALDAQIDADRLAAQGLETLFGVWQGMCEHVTEEPTR